MRSWEIYTCDLGHGAHPVVVVAHPLRVARKPDVDVVDCSSQRATRPAQTHEVVLDQADGLDWPTVCKCDLVYTAPKVEMKLGQIATNLVPDFGCQKWVGFAATIVGNPFLDICRSQIDVRIHGDSAALLEQMKGFHWVLSYGDYLKETGYALKKLGVGFLNVSAPKTA